MTAGNRSRARSGGSRGADTPAGRLESCLARPAPGVRGGARRRGPVEAVGPSLVAYLTAGYPAPGEFPDLLRAIAGVVDAVEIGVPFTDPMADGVTIQRTSREALERGVSLSWIMEMLREAGPGAGTATVTGAGAGAGAAGGTPILLMSYLNPLLAYGLERLVEEAPTAGVSGFIVPDLPWEECGPLRELTEGAGLALVQLVTPVTPDQRLATLGKASRGFVYAVTATGVTGGERDTEGIGDYLDRVRKRSRAPVCAGFGIRGPSQVAELAPHVDGVIVGSALLEVIERGEDPVAFLEGLRAG